MAAVSYAHKCKTIFLFVLSIGLGINISQAHTYEVHGGGDPKAIDNRVKTIVIDAGHGGKDPGALGRNSKEKEIVLALALKLGKEIKKNFPGVEVIYTRDSDKFVELHERAHIANQARADLFISIHCNSAASHQA
ncbi:MAG TPA: N-acetylmuramoyl-L-alanine amidase, partial [Membranihabitans sp.]|nr:N-acetylmuramoyl-L-alanine amidase [Membranihabitans sp.]